MAITTLMQRTPLDLFRLSVFNNFRPAPAVENPYDYLSIDDEEDSEELPIRKQCVGNHVISTFHDGATVIEGPQGTLSISPDARVIEMQLLRGGNIKFDLVSDVMHVVYPDGYKKRYALDDHDKQAIRAAHKLSLDVTWLPTDSDGTHHFQWAANVWTSAGITNDERFW